MKPIYKLYAGAVLRDSALNDREIRVIASDSTPDRVQDVMVAEGCVLQNYKSNPIVLANHDPDRPIGTAEASVKNGRVQALITFAPPGLSKTADEFCGLAKAGVLNAVSVGFDPIEAEPIKGGGMRYNKWELMELSVVSVPANPAALVIQRSHLSAARSSAAPLKRLSERERKEFEIRNTIRAEGLRQLDGAALVEWLKAEFPSSSEDEALRARSRRRFAMTIYERFMERKRESDFPAKVARTTASAAPELPAPSVVDQPLHFRWDPNEDGPTNMFNLRIHLGRGGRL